MKIFLLKKRILSFFLEISIGKRLFSIATYFGSCYLESVLPAAFCKQLTRTATAEEFKPTQGGENKERHTVDIDGLPKVKKKKNSRRTLFLTRPVILFWCLGFHFWEASWNRYTNIKQYNKGFFDVNKTVYVVISDYVLLYNSV